MHFPSVAKSRMRKSLEAQKKKYFLNFWKYFLGGYDYVRTTEKCPPLVGARPIRSPTDWSNPGTDSDFQNHPFWTHRAQPAGGAEILWIFDEKNKIFDTKLHESTGNRSQMFSGGVGDVCDALSRVCALSGGDKPKKFTKNQESESRFLTVP